MNTDKIRSLISKNKLNEAINVLKKTNQFKSSETLTLLELKFNEVNSDFLKNTITNEEKSVQLTKIARSILMLIGSEKNNESGIRILPPEEAIKQIEFVKIESGKTYFGSNKGQDNEKDQKLLNVKEPFMISSTPITQEVWKSIMNSEPWKNDEKVKEGNSYPAVCINWHDATEFAAKLSFYDQEGCNYRLPTEIEWEHTCRAGTKTEFHFGDNKRKINQYGWTKENVLDAGINNAQEVKKKLPNEWGVFDMHGNIWEWVENWYKGPHSDNSNEEIEKILKGGGWDYPAFGARSSMRNHLLPDRTNYVIGCRIVKEFQ